MPPSISEALLEILHHIQNNISLSQRKMSRKAGLSIEKINYILKSFSVIEFIKIDNLNQSSEK